MQEMLVDAADGQGLKVIASSIRVVSALPQASKDTNQSKPAFIYAISQMLVGRLQVIND